ncbi:MAG: hypothetical protein NVS1B11_36370 [Terriglobales bacterium]
MPAAVAKVNDNISQSWTISSLHDHVLGVLAGLDKRYEEKHTSVIVLFAQRFEDAQRAVDTAFIAQQTGINAALIGQEKAVAAALVAAEKAVHAALSSANEAVLKAEKSSESRFAGINEFRAQMGDQQRTLMPRAEVEVLIRGIYDKIESQQKSTSDLLMSNHKALSERIATNTETIQHIQSLSNSRLDTLTGRSTGINLGWGMAVGVIGLVVAMLAMIFKR